MPPIVCSRLFVWPSTLWPCTKCDRNIFSFYEKIPLIFWPAAAVSLQWISLPFRTIVAAIFCHIPSMLLTYSVTLAVWQSCSLACRHVIEERKCLGATPFQDFQLGLGGVVTLLLCCQGKCHGFSMISVWYWFRRLWLLKEIAQANYYVLRYLSSFSFQPNQISTTVPDIRFYGAY